VKLKGLLRGLLLGAEMPENTELTPVRSGSGLCIHCKRVTGPPGCQMVMDHWFYSRDKAVLWRLGEINLSFSLNQIHSWSSGWKDQLCHLARGLKFHSFVLLWPANHTL